MEYSTVGRGQEISAEGVVYDKGSIYGRLQRLTDLRKARGKRYSLSTVMMVVLLAKLSGANSPTEMAEWGIYHQAEIEALLGIQLKRMPERSTYRRILAYKIYETEVERLVGEYNQDGECGTDERSEDSRPPKKKAGPFPALPLSFLPSGII